MFVEFSDIEQYLQEMGRAGRDGLPSHAILHIVDLTVDIAESMKEFFKNRVYCRRELIQQFAEFSELDRGSNDTLCMCWDVYEKTCSCSKCIAFQNEFVFMLIPQLN